MAAHALSGQDRDAGDDDDDTAARPPPVLPVTPPSPRGLWDPPALAHSCTLKRYLSDGSKEPCSLYDPSSGTWLERFGVPLSAKWVMDRWGSGKYRVYYMTAENKAAGQGPAIDMQVPDCPPLPARANAPRAPQRAPVPQAQPFASAFEASSLGPPPVPKGLSGMDAIALMSWCQQNAKNDARQSMLAQEMFYRQQLATEAAAHKQALEDAEARAKRDRDESDARFARLMHERNVQFEHALKVAQSTSGKRELAEKYDELAEELDEMKEERERAKQGPKEDDGFLAQIFKPILASAEGRQKLVQIAASVAQGIANAGTPKVGP